MSKQTEVMKLALDALEAVTKEMLVIRDEIAERGGRPTANVFRQELWDSSFKAYVDHAVPAATALQEALTSQPVSTATSVDVRLAQQEPVRCPQKIINAITEYGDTRADQDVNNNGSAYSHERLADCIRLVREALKANAECVSAESEHLDKDQVFIDSLPQHLDDKMFMQISHWARQTYQYYQRRVRGNTITADDSEDTHLIFAAFRWVKENGNPLCALEEQPGPYEGVSEYYQQGTNGRLRIDPVTGNVGIGY